MQYIRTQHALSVIRRAFPDCTNIVGISERVGHVWHDSMRPILLSELGDYLNKIDAVTLELVDRRGFKQYPVYELAEFAQEFQFEPGDRTEVNVNQGKRPATVLAVIDNEALLEYRMPSGTTALWVVPRDCPWPGCKQRYSHKSLPKKWLAAIEEAGQTWIGNGQTR